MVNVRAQLRTLRMSPKKVRLVINLVRGMNAIAAEEKLAFLGKRAAEPVAKLLHSAIASALKNNNLKKESLRIAEVAVNPGPVTRRFRPRAHGSASPIRKHSSHITMTLSGVPEAVAPKVETAREIAKET